MENEINLSEQKFNAIFTYAPLGLAEIDQNGEVIRLNIAGGQLLKPLLETYQLPGDNIYPILDCINPEISEKIKNYEPFRGIVYNKLNRFRLPHPNNHAENHFQFNITKMFEDCIIVGFEDLTTKYQEEEAMHLAGLERAVAQGKFEIASEVLHDIGNAVVGFGSYLTRINRSMEQNNEENLQNVVLFLKAHQTALATAIGDQKAGALVSLLEGITQAQKTNTEEIRRSISEQLSIISHIQEILTIQRQYVVGHEPQDRKPVNLRDVIHDCRSMIFATYDKKGIAVTLNIPDRVPMIKGDRTKLMQVLLNVLKNSIEAIEIDGSEKNIVIQLLLEDNVLRLTIRDTGRGFDEATAAHLFERGFTTKNTGTGLGLYNCRSIIESHSGSFGIHSEGPGRGTTTTIKFNYENGKHL